MAGHGVSPLEAWLAMVQHSWLQVLVLVNKDTRSSSSSVAASEAVSFLQLLTVPIAVALELARRFPGASVQSTLPELLFGLSVVNPDSVKQVFGETVFLVLFAVALLSVTSFVVMAVVVAVTVASKAAKHSPYLLRTLRATAKLSSTSLFLPWTSMLLQALGCDQGVWWGGAGVECYGPLHISIAVVVLLLLPFFVGASLSVASVYIDRVPTSSQLDARTHGRADVLLLVIKMALTATLTYGTSTAPEWVLVGVLVVSGGLWLVLFLTMVPFAHLVMNAAHVGMASSFLWASLCAAIVWASEGSQDVGLLVLLGTPVAGLLGFASAYMHFYRTLAIRDPYTISSMWMVVLWTRERLRAARAAKRRRESAGSSGEVRAEAPPSAQAGKWGIKPSSEGETWFSVLEASAVSGIEALEDLFASVGIAHSIASTFYKSTVQLSHYKERQALTTARTLSRAFDIDFFFFQGLEDMQSGADSVKGDPSKRSMSVVDRVLFDQHKVTALEAQADCYAVHVMLMKHVSGRTMDVGFLHAELGAKLDDAMRRAAKAFDAMLRISPESPEALAYAADFQLQLAGNTTAAADLLQRAQRVEENNRRIKERRIATLAFNARADDDLSPSDDQNAAFIISTDRASLGEITSVNTAAVRIFGSSNMVGSNINVIIPRPVSDIHDSLLATFSQTGTSKFLDSTRVLVAQHSAGYLFPARFRILETPPSADDMRPRLTGLIAPLIADESFLIVGDESFDFSILSVCLKTAATLQRPVDALSDQGVPAAMVFPELFGSAGQGGVVDGAFPVPGAGQGNLVHGRSMRRAESNASSAFGGPEGVARRRQGHSVRPGSARSAAGTVLPGAQGDDTATVSGEGRSSHPHSGLPLFLDMFPPALRQAYAGPTRVNLFVPALLHQDDFDGADSTGAMSVEAFSHDGNTPKAGGRRSGLHAGLSCVEESEEPSEGAGAVAAVSAEGLLDAGAGAGAGADDAGGVGMAGLLTGRSSDGDVDSMGAAGSDSDESDGGRQRGWEDGEDDQDPATMRVEPQVIPVIVRCYALPKRHPNMLSGIFIAWTRADVPGRPGYGTRLVPNASATAGRPPLTAALSSSPAGATALALPGTTPAVSRPPGQDGDFGGDEEAVEQSPFRRALKRVLDVMTKGPSSGVTLMRRVLWATTLVFIVLVAVTLSALGPWATRVKRHVSELRHAGKLVELLHQSHAVVQTLSTEAAVRAAGRGGWPVTDLNATWTQLLRLPDRMDDAVTDYFSDIQALGGELLSQVMSGDAVTVKTETASGTRALGDASPRSRGSAVATMDAAREGTPSEDARAPARRLGSSLSSVANMPLFDALQTCQQALQHLSEQPFLSFTTSDPSAAFILANGGGAIGNAVNGTLLQSILALGQEINAIEFIELLTFIVVMTITVVGQLLLSTYASRNLWREQIALMKIFYEVPGKLAAAMASRAELKLRKHRRQTVGAVGNLAAEGRGVAEDSDDSAERQREEGEEIRWQLMVERMSRVAQQDWAEDQAAAHGVSVERYLGSRRATRSSIQLDALPLAQRETREDARAGRVSDVGGGAPGTRRWSTHQSRGRQVAAGGRRGSAAGRAGLVHKGDVRIRATLLKERREGVRTGDPSCTGTMILLINLAPSLLIAAWFVAVYYMDIAMHNRVAIDSQRLVHLQQQSIWADKLALTVADSAFLPSARDNVTAQALLLDSASLERDALIRRGSLVEHGGVSALAELLRIETGRESVALDPLPAHSPMQDIIHIDACPAVMFGIKGTYYVERGIVSPESCATAHKGVMSRGFSVSTSRLRSVTRAVDFAFRRLWATEQTLARATANASWAAQAGVDPAQLQREAASYAEEARTGAGNAMRLYDPWIRATMLSLEQDIVTSIEGDISSTWDSQRNLTIAFVIVFLLAVVTIFSPRLTWVERIVTATRRMLLVIPDEVLVGFPRIAESVREMEQAVESHRSLADTLGSTARKRESAMHRPVTRKRHSAVQPTASSVAPPGGRGQAPRTRLSALPTSESHGSMGSKVQPYMESVVGDSAGSAKLSARNPTPADAGPSRDLTEDAPSLGRSFGAGTEFKALPGAMEGADSVASAGTGSRSTPVQTVSATQEDGGKRRVEGGRAEKSVLHRGSLVMDARHSDDGMALASGDAARESSGSPSRATGPETPGSQ
ncbi:hypothetical protein FNF27_05405 [Cafeteria roenbergensis]|uniref:TmcB/TmcC TPR repeats domain-containing protein n=1 Tax=Cafeteria roenbergensis TaxID=33653 RepID=A0A5A8E5P4_CAFRO|nr:hypothetical protein FNF27_05405 [Cafeteria roenbergensis]